MRAEDGEDVAPVALELRRPDPGHCAELVLASWPPAGDLLERPIVEDDVRGDAVCLRALEAPGPECLEDRVAPVDGRTLRPQAELVEEAAWFSARAGEVEVALLEQLIEHNPDFAILR